jgi:hypothetical protein
MISKARHSPGKECSPFPENFDRDLYGFRDDFSLWMSALARRVALKSDIDSLLELYSALQDDFSEQRSALYSACRLDCQNKVMELINEPIPVNEKPFEPFQIGVACSEPNGNGRWGLTVDGGSDPKFFYGNSALANFENYLQKHEPIGGTLVLDGIWPPSTMVRTLSFPGEVGLKVNLFYDDDVLRASFSKWLEQARKAVNYPMAGKKVVKSKQLEDWHRMRVLPYMDLWLYQQAFNVNFDELHLARLLFRSEDERDDGKNGIGDEDYKNWLRNTKRRAESLIQQSVFFSLRHEEP